MPLVPITIMGYRCEQCGLEWKPRNSEEPPLVCPYCKSAYWQRKRQTVAGSQSRHTDDLTARAGAVLAASFALL